MQLNSSSPADGSKTNKKRVGLVAEQVKPVDVAIKVRSQELVAAFARGLKADSSLCK